MFKSILTFTLFISFCAVNAQTDSCTQHSPLKREKFRLAVDMPNGSVLKKDELKFMLSNDQFRGYNHARRCYVAAIPLLSVGTTYFTLGSILLSAGLSEYPRTLGGGLAIMVGAISLGIGSAFLIPGISLISYSAIKLNRIAKDYNSQYKLSYQPVKLHFGFVGNGIGLKLTF